MRSAPAAPSLRALALCAGLLCARPLAAAPAALVYVGTYGRAAAIHTYELDLADGTLRPLGASPAGPNPSFLALHPGGRFLYAVNEVDRHGGQPGGAVSAFSLDPRSGRLALLGRQPSGGAGPCYLSLDGAGRHLLVANYGGSVAVLPVGEDGRLGAPAAQSHDGEAGRRAHAHAIHLDPSGQLALAADLGLDQLRRYRLDGGRGALVPLPPPVPLPRSTGPRHLAFHPGGRHVYVLGERRSTVTTFAYDAASAELRPLQTLSTLPPGFGGPSYAADVQVHPEGALLYATNRGHDSIAVFRIAPGSGLLTPLGHHPSGGRTPRGLRIAPGGAFLLSANQGSGSLVVLRIDPRTGALSPTGGRASLPAPAAVQVLRR